MRNRIFLILALVLGIAPFCRGTETLDPSPAPFLQVGMEKTVRRHDIVYRLPAVRPWEYMPVGNGDVGLMVDPLGSMTVGGWVVKSDIWLQLHQRPILSGLYSLEEVQANWARGGEEAFKKMVSEEEQASDFYQGRVRPRVAGQVRSELRVDGQVLSNPNEIARDYEQRLDIYDAWVTTRFRWPEQVRTQATAFVHSGRNVIVFHYHDEADRGRKVSRRILLARPVWELYKFSKGFCCPPDGKGVEGRESFHLVPNEQRQAIVLEYSNASGLKMTMALRALGSGARLVVDRSKDPEATFPLNLPKPVDYLNPLPMRAGNAYIETAALPRLDVTVLAAVVTSEDNPDPTGEALRLLDETSTEAFAGLQQTHASWWHDFWKRSFVEIADKDIEDYWYQQSYQMASIARGKIPPGICQLWVATPEWPWQGAYFDFNNAAMHMAVQVTNHPELGDPYWRLMQRAMPGFRYNARTLYNAQGIGLPHTFGPDGYEGSTITWRYQLYHTALVGILEYWRYLYSLDRGSLQREIYPFLKEAVLYYQGLMRWNDLKKCFDMPVPSCSINEGGGAMDFARRNDPFDLACIKRLVLSAIQASEILGEDPELRAQWKDFESKVAPFPTDGRRYLLYEDERAPGHRLVVDTLGLAYPTGMVDTRNDPLWPPTLGDVVSYGMGGQCFTGMMWAAAAAWSGLGDALSTALHAEMRRHEFPNGLIGEGNLTFVPEYGRAVPGVVIGESGPWAQAAISEGLCRSLYDGVIRVFTAPPSYYRGRETPARFAGLRAIDGFVVSAEQGGEGGWGHARVRFIAIQSLSGEMCKVELPHWKAEDLVVEVVNPEDGSARRRLEGVTVQNNVASFPTERGTTYLLYPRDGRPKSTWLEEWNTAVNPNLQYVGLPNRVVP